MNENLVAELRKLARQYAYASIQMHENIAKKAGFSGTDHKYLGFFLVKSELTAGELSSLTKLTTGAVTALIDRFEEKELVVRRFDPKDRRKVIIVPDKEKIMALLEPFYKKYSSEYDKIVASFSDEEVEVIKKYLQKTLDLVDETNNNLQETTILINYEQRHRETR